MRGCAPCSTASSTIGCATIRSKATALGLDTGERSNLRFLLNDRSAAARDREQARSRRELDQLRTIDRARLGEIAAIDYDVVEYNLGQRIGGARFPYGAGGDDYSPYVLSHLSGAYRTVPDFLDSQHPIETKADADAYLARLSAFSKALDQNSELQRADAARGVFAPDYLLDRMLEVMKGVRDQPAARSQLVAGLARRAQAAGISGDHAATAAGIVADSVYPRSTASVRS
jgi:uncharacterized protein (DUF885 family)